MGVFRFGGYQIAIFDCHAVRHARAVSLTAPLPKGRGFPLHGIPPAPQRDTGLMVSPWADTARPAAKILRAAFMSRSCVVLHSGQTQVRMFSGSLVTVCPQPLQRLLDGYQRSMPINCRPDHAALYSSCRTNSAQPASLMDLDRLRFLTMFLTASVSTAITWFSLISRVESLCRKSLRQSAMVAWALATFSLALARFLDPLVFFASRRCNLAKRASCWRNVLGAAIFSPVESTAKCVSPKSMPT